MSYLFYHCSSLSILPDISHWDTSDVTNINYIFYKCSSLSFLPDISKWNTSKIKKLDCTIDNCHTLTFLPDSEIFDIFNIHVENDKYIINCLPKKLFSHKFNYKCSVIKRIKNSDKKSEEITRKYSFKFVFVGQQSVGKSSLILRFLDKSFNLNQKPTYCKFIKY